MNDDIFTKFKNERNYKSKTSNKPDFFFRFHVLNKEYVILDITSSDRKTKIKIPDYQGYNGALKTVLKKMQEFELKNTSKITWVNVEGLFVLSIHTEVLNALSKCTNLINESGDDITFISRTQKISLEILEETGTIRSELKIDESKLIKPIFINDEYVFDEDKIYSVESVGDKFNVLNDFIVKLDKTKFDNFLSLFFNSFPHINIKFSENYTIEDQITMEAKGVLYISKIDMHKNLFLRVLLTVPGIDPFLITEYGLDRVVSVNHLTKTIKLIEVDTTNSGSYFDAVEKKLDAIEREFKTKDGYRRMKSLYVISPAIATLFLENDLAHLLEKFDLLGDDKLEFFGIRNVKPVLTGNFNKSINYFEGAVLANIDGETISIFDLLEEFRKKSYITLSDNKKGIVNRSYMEKLNRIFKKEGKSVQVSFFDIPLMDDIFTEEEMKSHFYVAREFYMGFNNLSEREFPEIKVNATLRHYQLEGYKWLRYLYENSFGGCLADDMGLGKTLQSIALFSTIYPECEMPSLLIVPKSLLYNWKNELDKFAPDLTYSFYYGTEKDIDFAMKSNIIITTYETVRNKIDELKSKVFHIILLDESQKIKNITSAVSKAVIELCSEKRFALSGTPIENHLGELYTLFKFINPGMFGSESDFNEKYFLPIQKNNNTEVLKELKKKIYPFILRRLKKDVLTELPERVEQEIYVDMNDEHKAYYEKRRDFLYNLIKNNIAVEGIGSTQFHIFQAFNELRQIASMPEVVTDTLIYSTKKEILMDQLEELIDNGHKALVFANYLGILEILEDELTDRNIEFIKITGQTKNRQELVDRFQHEESCKVFLATLKTGGVGLNLTAADFVYIYDPWWNSSAENQAIDRAHRFGQKNTVFSYKLITKGTIEEKIIELQRSKNDLINSLLNGDSTGSKSINETDVDFLLGGNNG